MSDFDQEQFLNDLKTYAQMQRKKSSVLFEDAEIIIERDLSYLVKFGKNFNPIWIPKSKSVVDESGKGVWLSKDLKITKELRFKKGI